MFEAARKQGMKTVATFHEMPGEIYDAGRKYCPPGVDVNDPAFTDLPKDVLFPYFVLGRNIGLQITVTRRQ